MNFSPIPNAQCEICGCESLALFQVPYSIGIDVFPIVDPGSLCLCNSCGFTANDKSDLESYSEYYSVYNRHSTRLTGLSLQDRLYYQANISVIKDLSLQASAIFSNHLDIGPGDKLFTEMFAESFDCCSETYDIGDSFPSKCYDIITIFHSLEHWRNPKEQLKQFCELLGENGLLFITVPDILRYESTYYGAYAAVDSEHINHFSAYSMQVMLNLLGLKIVYWCHSDRQVSEKVFYPEIKIVATWNSSIRLTEDIVSGNLKFSSTELSRYLAKSRRDFNIFVAAVDDLVSKCKTNGRSLILYGLGIHGRRIAHLFPNLVLADSSPFFHGKKLEERIIYSPSNIQELVKTTPCEFLVSAVNSERIVEFLKTNMHVNTKYIHEFTLGRNLFPADQDFRSWRDLNILRNKSDLSLQQISLQWHDSVRKSNYQYLPEWFGRPIIQDPQDVLAIQEIIFKVNPTLIIETGIARGGSLSLSASLLAALMHCDFLNGVKPLNRRVIGIDVDIRKENDFELAQHPLRKMMKLIQASSIDPEILPLIEAEITQDDIVLVILDSNHTRDHVYEELCMYSKYVTSGSYAIVQDTGLEDADQASFSVERPWGFGNGPKTAVRDFLATSLGQDFHKTTDLPDKYLITSARDGFLIRF